MTSEAKILSGVGAVTLLIVVGAAFLMGGSSPNSQTLSVSQEKLLVRPDSNKIATSSAKLTVVEFFDYQCPACKAAHPITKKIMSDFKGKISFVFRHFAFLGQESIWAANASECAGEQGKFWEYHDYLYEHQGRENVGDFSKEKLNNFASALGLNMEPFKFCLETDKNISKVLNDTADGKELGVNSTPTFFINGEKLVGVPDYQDIKSRMESKLK